jgi:hypothetical protein
VSKIKEHQTALLSSDPGDLPGSTKGETIMNTIYLAATVGVILLVAITLVEGAMIRGWEERAEERRRDAERERVFRDYLKALVNQRRSR